MGREMKILLTGAGGFIGKNFLWTAKTRDDTEVMVYHHEMGDESLRKMCIECDAVVHLAGVNRPNSEREFIDGNVEFTKKLVTFLGKRDTGCPILFSSSIQAKFDNAYGRSKKDAERIIEAYADDNETRAYIYRLPNVFGKWCKPNYNSVVATFCHNIANGFPITIKDAEKKLTLVYIDDVIASILDTLLSVGKNFDKYCAVPVEYECSVGELARIIRSFKECRTSLSVPDMDEPFIKRLYSTYLSYLPQNGFSYKLLSHEDNRGSFTEFIRTVGQGQISVNVSKPHVVKGGHWHQSKHEKFLVVKGEGIIRLRKVDEPEAAIYKVSDRTLEVIEIPPGYTHEIENIGDTDMVTLMWANENFDSGCPDTYKLEV